MAWVSLSIRWLIVLAAIFFGASGIATYLAVFTSLDVPEQLIENLVTLWIICCLLIVLAAIVGMQLEERDD